MKKVAVISQPRFLPALNYIHRMDVCDVFVLLDTVQYTPRDWENRNRIKTASGPQWLRVPVKSTGRGMLIQDTQVDNTQQWQGKIANALKQHYSRAPFFSQHMPFVEDALTRRWERLTDINVHFIDYACRSLDITCSFVFASELGAAGAGEELLIDICRRTGAEHYLSGPLGRNYIKAESWTANGIALSFHEYRNVPYPQMYGEFLPWMCFFDLLMNCGPQSRQYLCAGQAELS